MDYETLNEQEWLALLTEMTKADNVIKRKLAKVLVNKSEFFSQRDKVDSYKNVTRRITVFNTRTDKVLMQMTGVMSLKTDSDTKELNVIVKDGETYHKHMIFLNDDTTYVVEDIGGADVSRSAYEIHFLPEVLESGLIDVKVDK